MSAAAGDFALSLRAVGKRYGRIRALEGAFAAASSVTPRSRNSKVEWASISLPLPTRQDLSNTIPVT